MAYLERAGCRRWGILLVLLLLDVYGLNATQLSITTQSWVLVGKALLLIAGLGMLLRVLPSIGVLSSESARAAARKVTHILSVVLYLQLFFCLVVILTYWTIALRLPLIDRHLDFIDRQLGFNWLASYRWLQSQRWLQLTFRVAYQSFQLQIAAVLFFTALFAPQGRMHEFIGLMLTSCLIAVACAGFLPAQGAYFYYGLPHAAGAEIVSHFPRLYQHTLQTIDLAQAQGLVSMPSYHCSMAIFFVYAMRGSRWQIPVILLNTVMILSTPFCGGHYLIDVLTGVLLSAALIIWSRRKTSDVLARASHAWSIN